MILSDIIHHFPAHFPVLKTLMAGIVAFVLGLLWYHPKVMGDTRKGAREQPQPAHMLTIVHYGIIFMLWMVTSAVYTFLTTFLMPPSIGALLGLATFIWVGFILPAVVIGNMFTGKSIAVMAVDSAYFLAGLYLFAVIHDVL